MKTDKYKRRLLAEDKRLLSQMARAGGEARETTSEVHDRGDESNDDVRKEEEFAVASADWITLGQVREEQELAAGVHARRVRQDFDSGLRSGVNGTPTFFINGWRYDGPWDLTSLLEAVGGLEPRE